MRLLSKIIKNHICIANIKRNMKAVSLFSEFLQMMSGKLLRELENNKAVGGKTPVHVSKEN